MELRSGRQGVEENNSTDKSKGKDFQKGSVKAKKRNHLIDCSLKPSYLFMIGFP